MEQILKKQSQHLLHSVRLIHRYIKPSNIYITNDGISKVGLLYFYYLFQLYLYILYNYSGDFGISRLIFGDKLASTVGRTPFIIYLFFILLLINILLFYLI
jgi:serine/threonine protein kinase